jgi:thiol-disulfide isomerase/thioredoxin
MKNKLSVTLAIAVLLLSSPCIFAAETNDTAVTDLHNLVSKINTKLMAGKIQEADLADNLKEFDVLLAKHKGDKPEDLAQILMMKAQLYLEVLHDPEKAADVFQQIKHDFPTTEIGKRVDTILDSLKQPIEAQRIRRMLVEGSQFQDFNEKDVTGKPLSIANYKGKVVLIDFWATWCLPCVAEMPNVIQTYQKHHAQGFEIIGISLDKDQQTLERFIKDNNMTWPEFFDGQDFGNKLAVKYGIMSIPATFLLDRKGKIIAKDLRGEGLEQAVAKALAKK